MVPGGDAAVERSQTGPSRDRETAQVTGQVVEQVLRFCQTPRKASEIRELLNLKHRETFTDNYLRPLLEKGWLEPTIPDKPRSRLQRYKITEAGRAILEK
jgi:ATP-dependent DNA helicase RecG